MPPISIIIPSRLQSTRLPRKPLSMIGEKTMIEQVVEQSIKTGFDVLVACDDQSILDVVKSTAATAVLTRPACQSGTDRILEVMNNNEWSDDHIIINCQGDEPLMPPENIIQLGQLLQNNPEQGMASLYITVQANDEAVHDPNHVKVVCDRQDRALYFSRSPLPFYRDAPCSGDQVKLHLGLYAYRVGFLKQWQQWPIAPIEQAESLEQLRALWHGYTIQMACAQITPPMGGVDTPKDLEKARALIHSLKK